MNRSEKLYEGVLGEMFDISIARDQIRDGEYYDTVDLSGSISAGETVFFSNQSNKTLTQSNVTQNRQLQDGNFVLIKDFIMSLNPTTTNIALDELVKVFEECHFIFQIQETTLVKCRLTQMLPFDLPTTTANKVVAFGEPPKGSGYIVSDSDSLSGIPLKALTSFTAKLVADAAVTCASIDAITLSMRGTTIVQL